MLRGRLLIGVIALWSVSAQQGCDDLKKSLTRLSYYPIRDMRQTIAIDPQRHDPTNPKWMTFVGPDSLSVPTIGVDRWRADAPYEGVEKHVFMPPEPDPAAAAVRGDTLFHNFCWTCHGMTMVGDGPVAATFMPPPDLLAEATRNRSDGFLFMYVRHGGVIMPSYGNALSAHDTWDIVHYIRQMQKASPR